MEEFLASRLGTLAVVRRYWLYVVLGIIGVDIMVLNFFLFFFKSESAQTAPPQNVSVSNTPQTFCSQSCVDQINLAIANSSVSSAIQQQITPTLTPTPTLAPSPTPTQVQTVKEFFVPLGIGSGNSADWKVVNGIGAKIDPVDYGSIKTVTFEVSARIPTGNQTIWIRLYNADSFQSVPGSDLTLSGGTATLLVSSPIDLVSGDNLYQVQMKTQLQYTANIDMARIRIKTN